MTPDSASYERELPEVSNDLTEGFDPEFEKKWWTAEHVSWLVMIIVLIAGLCGFLGRGAWSRRTIDASANGFTIKYERVVRYKTPTLIIVRFHPDAMQGQHLLLRISDTVVQQLGEQLVVPQPTASTVVPGGLLYSFPINNSGQPQQVSLGLEPATVGPVQIQLQIPGRPPFTRSVFALP